MKFEIKIGDIVAVEYCKNNGDWNNSRATMGIVLSFEGNTTKLELLDSKTRYTTAWVGASSVIPHCIVGTPLYKALHED